MLPHLVARPGAVPPRAVVPLRLLDLPPLPGAEEDDRPLVVLAAEPCLPERLARVAPHMMANDWLGSYRDFAVLEQVLRGIARRLSRPEELNAAMAELERLYEPLSDDFRLFYPQLQVFSHGRLAT